MILQLVTGTTYHRAMHQYMEFYVMAPVSNSLSSMGIPNHSRSISSSVSKVADGGHGQEKASKRLASLQVMRPATARRDAAPAPDFTRYKGG